MFLNVKLTQGHTMAHVFVNHQNFSRIKPMKKNSQAGDALARFVKNVGIPTQLLVDDAKEHNQGKWKKG